MNRYLTIFFLLFMLLVMGAFASMAQNSYGFAMLGWVSLGFALVFLVQLIRKLTGKKRYSASSILELVGLITLTALFALNNFHVRIPFSVYLASAAALLLVVVYSGNLWRALQKLEEEEKSKKPWIIVYYAGVILFLLSFAVSFLLPTWTGLTNTIAFVLLMLFVVGAFLVPGFKSGWKQNHALHIINGFRDRSFVLACIFFLMAAYGAGVRAGLLPPLYSDDYPKVYFDMSGQKGTGAPSSARSEVSQAEFKEKYERFVERNLEQGK